MTHVDAAPRPIPPISVLIVGHVRLYRDGLIASLRGRDRLALVGASEDFQTTLLQLPTARPDVIVIDMSAPRALDIIGAVRRCAAATKIIAFAVYEQESQIIECMEAGAAAYVTCDSSIDELVAVIESVARDELVCSPRIAATIVRRLAARVAMTDAPIDDRALTARETQVLRLIREGLSNKEIGSTLNIAEATVKNHVHHILEKLEVSTRNQAIARLASLSDLDRRVSAR